MIDRCARSGCTKEGRHTVTGSIPTIAGDIQVKAKICEEHYRHVRCMEMMTLSLLTPKEAAGG